MLASTCVYAMHSLQTWNSGQLWEILDNVLFMSLVCNLTKTTMAGNCGPEAWCFCHCTERIQEEFNFLVVSASTGHLKKTSVLTVLITFLTDLYKANHRGKISMSTTMSTGSPAPLTLLSKFLPTFYQKPGHNHCKYFDTPVPLVRVVAAGYQCFL